MPGCTRKIRSDNDKPVCCKCFQKHGGFTPRREAVCLAEGCGKRIRTDNTLGYCAKHKGLAIEKVTFSGWSSGVLCSREGCNRPHRANGLCKQHNWQEWKASKTEACCVAGCTGVQFVRGMCRNHSRKDYETEEYRSNLASTHKDRMKTDPEYREKIRATKRKEGTGMGQALVDGLRILQAGKCAICTRVMGLADRKAHDGECADHCHGSKKPRGLLCSICNRALGFYERRQRPGGLILEPYEQYLANPPASKLRPENDNGGLNKV